MDWTNDILTLNKCPREKFHDKISPNKYQDKIFSSKISLRNKCLHEYLENNYLT